jgi:aspartate/methionine/tyrosine aminotransferase
MEFLAKAKLLESEGVDVCHLEIGDPDFDTPKHITLAAELALGSGATHYEPSGGSLKLRESVAEWFNNTRPGLNASPANVLCTPGGKNIIFQTIAALVEAGDEVIYPNPGFPAYETTIEWFHGKPVPLKLDEKTGFRFDHDELRRIASPKTKLIIICSPGNPSGGILSAEDLDVVAEVAKASGAWVLSDEIYSQLIFDGQHDSVATRPGMQERTVVLDGCSKNWAMTGWRVGFGLFPTPLVEPARNVCINTFSCLPPFVSAGAMAAVEGSAEPTEKMKAEFMARRDIVFDRLNEIPGVKVSHKPGGAMYLMADVSGTGLTASEFADRVLFEHGVALLDGAFFGEFGVGLVRISFAQSRERLAEACDRIADFCEGVKEGREPKNLKDDTAWPDNLKSLTSLTSMTSVTSLSDAPTSLTSLSSYDAPFLH